MVEKFLCTLSKHFSIRSICAKFETMSATLTSHPHTRGKYKYADQKNAGDQITLAHRIVFYGNINLPRGSGHDNVPIIHPAFCVSNMNRASQGTIAHEWEHNQGQKSQDFRPGSNLVCTYPSFTEQNERSSKPAFRKFVVDIRDFGMENACARGQLSRWKKGALIRGCPRRLLSCICVPLQIL